MILVTGAAGKTGQAVVRALLRRSDNIRAVVHTESQIRLLQELGAGDVVAADIGSQPAMNRALQGVTAIYHICPNVSPDEVQIGRVLIKAAQTMQVGHFVFHSVFHPHVRSMPHHWKKMQVEQLLFKSGLRFTILQPAPYMQNIVARWDAIVNQGRYPVPYSANTRLSLVDLEDVAEVAATVLRQAVHEGATYELCGAESLSQIEVCDQLSSHLGQRVDVQVVPLAEWEEDARNRDVGEYQVLTLIKMFRYYDRFGYRGNSRILECLLHRPATSFATFLARVTGDGRP